MKNPTKTGSSYPGFQRIPTSLLLLTWSFLRGRLFYEKGFSCFEKRNTGARFSGKLLPMKLSFPISVCQEEKWGIEPWSPRVQMSPSIFWSNGDTLFLFSHKSNQEFDSSSSLFEPLMNLWSNPNHMYFLEKYRAIWFRFEEKNRIPSSFQFFSLPKNMHEKERGRGSKTSSITATDMFSWHRAQSA